MLIGKQISGLCLLFSSKRVCCHCGARHNHNINLCETELQCANRLRAKHTQQRNPLIISFMIRYEVRVVASSILAGGTK